MTKQPFAPKDAEALKTEIINDLQIDYDGNEEMIDKIVDRELKSEQFKASLHADKEKHLARKEQYKKMLAEAGVDPKSGKKKSNDSGDKTPQISPAIQAKNMKALKDVHEDDYDYVFDVAQKWGIEPYEAVKREDVQYVLKTHEEHRQTAQAANAGGGRRGTSKVSDESILADAMSGKEVDPEKLAEAKRNERLGSLKR